MKIFEALKDKDSSSYESLLKQKKKVEYKKVFSMRYIAGHRVFEYNYETNILREAEYKKNDTIHFNDVLSGKVVKRDMIQKNNCIYIQSLNSRNAIKKIAQLGFETYNINYEKSRQ